MSDEGTYLVPLKMRSRLNRAIRWPLWLWRYRKAGASWASAWRLTHHIVWYRHA